ncbi:hypothetical protein C8J56DRAFT_856035 [Mycena floridula]|nr:hypothetical protein C8J56DRAFT_856035 [Mycena floridula]
MLWPVALFLPVSLAVLGPGGSCNSSKNHLDPNTHKFISACSDTTFCSAIENGTCTRRLCRRDEFPFGYSSTDVLPTLCPTGTFCPDEGDGCKPLVPVGGACQLNRDEQCAAPMNWDTLSSTQNFNGAICLHSICMYANATFEAPCITEETTYIETDDNGQQFSYTIARDNCSPGLYCPPNIKTCEPTKPLGATCQSDQECELRNCAFGTCLEPPETPFRVQPWQYAIITICVVGAMVATIMLLTLIHKRHRLERYRELCEYHEEQSSLRKAIISLHYAAVDQKHQD